MNLDWLLEKMKELGIDVENFKQKIETEFGDLEKAFEEFTFEVADQIIAEVDNWLEKHPEATTTVEDGSITIKKMVKSLRYSILCPPIYNFANIGRLPYRRSAEAFMQGGVATDSNTFFQYSNGNNELLKFNLASGLTINRNIIPLGHCNSLAHIESENKILAYGTFGEDNLPYNRLTVIDAMTLEVLDEIDLELPNDIELNVNPIWEYGYMCAYDNDNNALYVAGQRYIKQTTESYIIKYNYDNGLFTLDSYGLMPKNMATSSTDMCVFDGSLFILTSEQPQIIIIDLEDYTIMNSVPVNRTVSSLTYAPEFESITIINGEIIVGYRATCFKNMYGGGSYVYAKTPFTNSPIVASKTTPEFTKVVTLYVNNSNNKYDRDGSVNNPFNNIYEAMNCAYNFSHVNIFDRSTNEDSFVLAIEPEQHVYFNADQSVVNYGIRMDGGYLFAWWTGASQFNVGSNYYYAYLQNGAECTINAWRKQGTSAVVELEDDTVYMDNGSKLVLYTTTFTNINAFIMGRTCTIKQIADASVSSNNLITPTIPTDVHPKTMHGFRQLISTDPNNLYIPVECSLCLCVKYNNKNYFLHSDILGNQSTWDIAGQRINLSLARTDQWAQVTLTYDANITFVNLEVWLPL